MLKMGEVSQNLGLNPQTVYFYERIGLIPPLQRTKAGYRLFSQEDVDRLAFISHGKSLGLSLDEIKEILDLKADKSLTCHQVYERLHKKIQTIRENIQQLQALHDELMPLLEQCQTNLELTNLDRQCIVLDPAPR